MTLTSIVAVTLLAAAALQEPAGPPQAEKDRAELARLETVWNEAHVKGDAEARRARCGTLARALG